MSDIATACIIGLVIWGAGAWIGYAIVRGGSLKGRDE